MNIRYTIARYENIDNNRFLVAFNVFNDLDENSAYIECILSTDEISGKTKNEICNMAHSKLVNDIKKIKQKFESEKDSLIGFEFIPDINVATNNS